MKILILPAALILCACQSGQPQKAETQLAISDRDWQRSKDCAAQALLVYRQAEQGYRPAGEHRSHYSATMGKCFVETMGVGIDRSDNSAWSIRTIADAYEGQVYASYDWNSERGKRGAEVAPSECQAFLPPGQWKNCKSEDEFRALTKVFMGDAPR